VRLALDAQQTSNEQHLVTHAALPRLTLRLWANATARNGCDENIPEESCPNFQILQQPSTSRCVQPKLRAQDSFPQRWLGSCNRDRTVWIQSTAGLAINVPSPCIATGERHRKMPLWIREDTNFNKNSKKIIVQDLQPAAGKVAETTILNRSRRPLWRENEPLKNFESLVK